MNFEKIPDEDEDFTKLSPYTPAEIHRMKDELKLNKAKARLMRFELERKRRFRDVEEAKQKKALDALQAQVVSLEKIRTNMETHFNGKRRDNDMREIGELLLRLNHVEGLVASAKKLSEREQAKVKEENLQLRQVEKQFRQAPDDVNVVAMKKQKLIESRYLAVQRKHDKLKKQAQDAQRNVEQGMMLRQSFRESYTRIERQYDRNATLLKKMLSEISLLNDKRSEFLKKAAQNRGAANELRDEVMNKLRAAEREANIEYETRNLSVCRAVDRTPYWKNESISKAIQSFHDKPAKPTVTMQETVHLEETMTAIRRIMNVDNMSDVIKLFKKREENNELLAERLRDLNKEAEELVDKIEAHHKTLKEIDEKASKWEETMERKMMMLLERTRTMEENGKGCMHSLRAFREFYDKIGPKMTRVHDLMYKLIPHSHDMKAPEGPCTGENYREYQMSFSRLTFYFHAIFDYWKQHEHERKMRTDPLYRGTDDDDHPLALQEAKQSHVNYPVSAKLKLLPRDLRSYSKRNQFENEDGSAAMMSATSMEFFAKNEAAELQERQNEYLRGLDSRDAEAPLAPETTGISQQLRLSPYLLTEQPDSEDMARLEESNRAAERIATPPVIGVRREPPPPPPEPEKQEEAGKGQRQESEEEPVPEGDQPAEPVARETGDTAVIAADITAAAVAAAEATLAPQALPEVPAAPEGETGEVDRSPGPGKIPPMPPTEVEKPVEEPPIPVEIPADQPLIHPPPETPEAPPVAFPETSPTPAEVMATEPGKPQKHASPPRAEEVSPATVPEIPPPTGPTVAEEATESQAAATAPAGVEENTEVPPS